MVKLLEYDRRSTGSLEIDPLHAMIPRRGEFDDNPQIELVKSRRTIEIPAVQSQPGLRKTLQ